VLFTVSTFPVTARVLSLANPGPLAIGHRGLDRAREALAKARGACHEKSRPCHQMWPDVIESRPSPRYRHGGALIPDRYLPGTRSAA
jgi:hypothetical protein